MKKKQIALSIAIASIAVVAAIIIVIVLFCVGNRKETYSSPDKTNSVTISYDLVSRPSVIYDGKKIWEYQGSGFNEEAYFDVIWQSEDTFILRYDDPSHGGEFSEEYLIKLE